MVLSVKCSVSYMTENKLGPLTIILAVRAAFESKRQILKYDAKCRTSHPEMLTGKEMESVTTVFRSFESGLRGATISPSVSFSRMLITIFSSPGLS